MTGVRYLACAAMIFGSSSATAFELPLFAEEARAQGYTLPEPFGLSVGAMHVEQGIVVDSISLSNLGGLPEDLITPLEGGVQDSQVYTLRADAWLLPFLNVYAIGGKMTGSTKARVAFDFGCKPSPFCPKPIPFDFELDLDGYLYGGGVVIAGGVGSWFTLIDASLTKTKLTVIDGEIDAFVLSPRVGYDFANSGLPLRVWIGGMFQEVEQHLSGKIGNLGLPPIIDSIVGEGRFEVEQHLKTPWNTLVGFQYQFARDWSLIGEAGLGERKSAMLSMEYRF
ncbi:virulence protein [Shewanella submarina]|uniref:Virulence protein n=1 Tax=Shewanella submarina TaxID=2016376 RepID=A0ABV7GKI6_9GAMM|nr:virulence protein [Shewanella submarina]MCL1036382.1 virulence protein [Shewanella submarina]